MKLPLSPVYRFVWINAAAAVLVGIPWVVVEVVGSTLLVLLNGILVLAFLTLGLANLVGMFVLWKKFRLRAFLPFATYVCSAAVLVTGVRCCVMMILAGTPQRPDTFPRGKAKLELERDAAQLLGHSFKMISTRSDDRPPVRMVNGVALATVPPELLHRLKSLGIDSIYIDDSQSLVTFGSCHLRSWYYYLYTPQGLEPDYSGPSTITATDIETWTELARMARQGPTMTEGARCGIVFDPEVVYPVLIRALGEDRLKMLGEPGQTVVTPAQKALVLQALNDQRQVASRLVEDPCITYSDREHCHLSVGCPIGDDFWVSKLLETLLRSGVIQRATDNRHLRIKESLTEKEKRQVEWLHVGLMNFLYGNLLEKRNNNYGLDLGDGWYFERD